MVDRIKRLDLKKKKLNQPALLQIKTMHICHILVIRRKSDYHFLSKKEKILGEVENEREEEKSHKCDVRQNGKNEATRADKSLMTP